MGHPWTYNGLRLETNVLQFWLENARTIRNKPVVLILMIKLPVSKQVAEE